MEKLLKELYKRKNCEDLSALTKDELLEVISKDDKIAKSSLISLIRDVRIKDYSKVYKEYISSTEDIVENLIALTKDFKLKDKNKDKTVKEVISILKQEDKILLSPNLPHYISELIEHTLDKKDLESSAFLMKKRIKMEKDGNQYAGFTYRHTDHVDRMDFMDKFVELIAEQCDKKTADKYIKGLGKGEYASLTRIIDGQYYIVGENYIRGMYENYKNKLNLTHQEI